jgi:hypothetical protein
MDKSTILPRQLCRIVRCAAVLGAVRRVALVAAFVTVIPQIAYAEASDDYVACVIGKAVVNLHKGSSHDDAVAKAWIACEPLNKEISENELEGISDFVYLTFEKLAANPVQ